MATKSKPRGADVLPFWQVMLGVKFASGACPDGTSFLVRHQPQTLDEAVNILVQGMKRAAASGRTDSAYAKAYYAWVNWLARRRDTHGIPVDRDIPGPDGYKFFCEHCGMQRTGDSVPVMLAYHSEHKGKLPVTENGIREAYARTMRHASRNDDRLCRMATEDAQVRADKSKVKTKTKTK